MAIHPAQIKTLIAFILFGMGCFVPYAQVEASQERTSIEVAAFLLDENGHPRCRIGNQHQVYLSSARLSNFVEESSAEELYQIKECDQNDALYAGMILAPEEGPTEDMATPEIEEEQENLERGRFLRISTLLPALLTALFSHKGPDPYRVWMASAPTAVFVASNMGFSYQAAKVVPEHGVSVPIAFGVYHATLETIAYLIRTKSPMVLLPRTLFSRSPHILLSVISYKTAEYFSKEPEKNKID